MLAYKWCNSRTIALKDKRPAINIWQGVFRYQANGGISLGYRFVAQGASNSDLWRYPKTPPKASNGIPTQGHTRRITVMVPNGSAAVAPKPVATILRMSTVTSNGPRYRIPARRTLHSWKLHYLCHKDNKWKHQSLKYMKNYINHLPIHSQQTDCGKKKQCTPQSQM